MRIVLLGALLFLGLALTAVNAEARYPWSASAAYGRNASASAFAGSIGPRTGLVHSSASGSRWAASRSYTPRGMAYSGASYQNGQYRAYSGATFNRQARYR